MTVQLTPAQYQTKVAYRIDPLMAASVEIVQPHWQSRGDGEIVDASGFWKDYSPDLVATRRNPVVLTVGNRARPDDRRMSIAHARLDREGNPT